MSTSRQPPFRKSRLATIVSMLIVLALTACSDIDYAQPTTEPRPLAVRFTPALGWIRADLNRCAQEIPEIALVVTEAPASGLDFEAVEVYLRLGAPPEEMPHFATLLGHESVVIIAHPDVNPAQLEIIDVNLHYTRLDTTYQPWTYPPGDDLRVIFDAVVLAGASPSPQTQIAPNPQAMLAIIAATPGSIGYSSTHWLQPEVQAAAPGEDYVEALRQPILALTASEPEGSTRQFLACLQSE